MWVATAMGAPVIADTANAAPTAAKTEVTVRDVGRTPRLFAPLESGMLVLRRRAMKFPLLFWFLPATYRVLDHPL
jgi:hypothetical protein